MLDTQPRKRHGTSDLERNAKMFFLKLLFEFGLNLPSIHKTIKK